MSGDGYYGFQKLANDLNEVDFMKISERYPFSNDDFFVATEVMFENGKSKKLYGYNGKRYLWLVNFYENADYLVTQQKWKKID